VASQYGVDMLSVLFLTPLPGTRLWDRMKSEDRIILDAFREDWKYYTLTFPVARYKRLSLDDVIQEMISCNRHFYSRAAHQAGSSCRLESLTYSCRLSSYKTTSAVPTCCGESRREVRLSAYRASQLLSFGPDSWNGTSLQKAFRHRASSMSMQAS
jgi:hypothetical protein